MFIVGDVFNRPFSSIVYHVRLHVQRYRELFDRKLNQRIAVQHYTTIGGSITKGNPSLFIIKNSRRIVGNFKIIQFTRTKIMS